MCCLTYSTPEICNNNVLISGGLELSHRLALPTRDYPGCPGQVTQLKWTPDSTCLVMVWAAGGFSIWSTFGTMIFCNLGWDHGPRILDAVRKSPYNIQVVVEK